MAAVQHLSRSESAQLNLGYLFKFNYDFLPMPLAREQIKHLPHPGVVFCPLAASVKADYWIAWHRENGSKALEQYSEIVKLQGATPR